LPCSGFFASGTAAQLLALRFAHELSQMRSFCVPATFWPPASSPRHNLTAPASVFDASIVM
jgi:hypothetical protein